MVYGKYRLTIFLNDLICSLVLAACLCSLQIIISALKEKRQFSKALTLNVFAFTEVYFQLHPSNLKKEQCTLSKENKWENSYGTRL